MGGFGSFTDPLITGGGALIRALIKSVNYVAGVSGWILDKDGSAEFSNATVRGAIEAGGGTVKLNSGGVKVIGPTLQYDINTVGGFLVRRVPDDGSSAQLSGNASGMGTYYNVANPSVNGATMNPGRLEAVAITVGSNDVARFSMNCPTANGKFGPTIREFSQGSTSTADDSHIDIDVAQLKISSSASPLLGPTILLDGNDIGRGFHVGADIIASGGAVGATETAVLTTAVKDFKPGRIYKVVITGGVSATVANNTPLFRIRKTNNVGQQFDAFRVACISTATHPARYDCYFQVGATTVNAAICLTLTGSGAFNATLTAAATSPATMYIYDDGDASLRPNAPTLI